MKREDQKTVARADGAALGEHATALILSTLMAELILLGGCNLCLVINVRNFVRVNTPGDAPFPERRRS